MATFLGPGASKPRRRLVAILGWAALAIVVVLRLLTLARDTWEWDELLFLWAARDGVDVRVNHPHPPATRSSSFPPASSSCSGRRRSVRRSESPSSRESWRSSSSSFSRGSWARGSEESLWAGLLWACIPAGLAPLGPPALRRLRGRGVPPRRPPPRARLPGAGRRRASSWPRWRSGRRPGSVHRSRSPSFPSRSSSRSARSGLPLGVRRAAWAAGAGLAAGLLPYVPVVAGSGGLGAYLVAAKAVAEYVRSLRSPVSPGVRDGRALGPVARRPLRRAAARRGRSGSRRPASWSLPRAVAARRPRLPSAPRLLRRHAQPGDGAEVRHRVPGGGAARGRRSA